MLCAVVRDEWKCLTLNLCAHVNSRLLLKSIVIGWYGRSSSFAASFFFWVCVCILDIAHRIRELIAMLLSAMLFRNWARVFFYCDENSSERRYLPTCDMQENQVNQNNRIASKRESWNRACLRLHCVCVYMVFYAWNVTISQCERTHKRTQGKGLKYTPRRAH